MKNIFVLLTSGILMSMPAFCANTRSGVPPCEKALRPLDSLKRPRPLPLELSKKISPRLIEILKYERSGVVSVIASAKFQKEMVTPYSRFKAWADNLKEYGLYYKTRGMGATKGDQFYQEFLFQGKPENLIWFLLNESILFAREESEADGVPEILARMLQWELDETNEPGAQFLVALGLSQEGKRILNHSPYVRVLNAGDAYDGGTGPINSMPGVVQIDVIVTASSLNHLRAFVTNLDQHSHVWWADPAVYYGPHYSRPFR